MTLQITREGKVVIRTPLKTPDDEIERFFLSRRGWIVKKIKGRRTGDEGALQPRRFVAGEVFLYLGEAYPLEIGDSNGGGKGLVLRHGKFVLAREKMSQARDVFRHWYRERAREILAERVAFWGRRFALAPARITITSAWQRYGSCSSTNALSFSWRLLMAPYPVIDYIIIHELAHIKEKNHSRKFWAYLESLMPEYETPKEWLRENGCLLRL